MHELAVSRRTLLGGLGAAGTLGLSGCISGLNRTRIPEEGSGYFIPDSDSDWGAGGPATWFAPGPAHTNEEAITSVGQFSYRDDRLNVWGTDLGEDLELLFVGPHGAIEVYEGAFTAQDAMKTAQDVFFFTDESEYDYGGFQVSTQNWNGLITLLAFQDGRVIKINHTAKILDPYAAIEAVIDTVTGDRSPNLPTQPYFRKIRSELDTQLLWEYRPVESLPRLPDLWAEGQSIRTTGQDELVARHVYGFTSRPDLDQATLDSEIESAFDDRMRPPTTTQQDNLLILEASTPIPELDYDHYRADR